MAYTKTIDDCDDYFKPNMHLNAYDWRAHDKDVREAAFNQAQRELEVSLGSELEDPETGDTYRCDYAHFEQALFILMNTARQESDGADRSIDSADAEDMNAKAPARRGVLISPQAQRYLGVNRIKISRG